MLNLTKWCKEISYCNKLASSPFAKREFDGTWENSSRFSCLWHTLFYCVLFHAVCGEADGYHVFATFSPTKVQNSFFRDTNRVLSCTSSRKLCCQFRPLTPCPNSASHMDLALANNAEWPGTEQWEEALECELLSPSHRFCNSWASRWPYISALGTWLSEPSSRGSLWKYSLCFWALQPRSLWAYITHKTQLCAETARSCESLWWTWAKEGTHAATWHYTYLHALYFYLWTHLFTRKIQEPFTEKNLWNFPVTITGLGSHGAILRISWRKRLQL